ncbi:TusE/DsrC/DsvC family sulfur relay protein [Thalassotalea litorea]|uniref:Sulfurtransferase n=1 Tax=Thalassotalea litorea TaxID=2020715 RepID=A0A5R9IL07_9GAMM|nr:TusE/DsrC/DsvC family sulfur relay protein [Thalassotalea litorea]TLU66210.1 TusE/DsrC/DsvC family sulfur relay protein [Thalassotalea litorea]
MAIEFNGQSITTDKEGYLTRVDDWQPELAKVIAETENIQLTDDHWEVVNFVRNFYLEYKTSPAIRALIKALKAEFPEEKANSRYLYRLFPKGPAKQATKIAGLPKPARCI